MKELSEKVQTALRKLSIDILVRGEREEIPLIPSDMTWLLIDRHNKSGYEFLKNRLKQIDDVIIDKFEATHYSLKWRKPLESVTLTLLKGEAFGAVFDLVQIEEIDITLDKDRLAEMNNEK